ncbi:outer envelope protein 61-like, partial [Bidens hawaiensis]|uniref:outer envelope protein 61-like n=1 Tax=Bidens hawaiensis TaxID=980011 RepID=UPI00404AD3F2
SHDTNSPSLFIIIIIIIIIMDPEMIRLAQEQMSRMSPADLSRIQHQMMSNPELMKMASDSMKNMKPEDLRRAAEQLKYTQPDQMAEIGAKMANTTPEEFAAMSSRAGAQINYQVSAAQMLKQKGNELHSQGMYNEALEKYLRAKNNVKDVPASKGGTLLLACSLNLMACYLKTSQFDECIKEGIEVLETDTKNVKALYRRGQAYKNLGQFEDAVSDLKKALEFSPDDETIADVLRDAEEKLNAHSGEDIQRGLKIEEITDKVPIPLSTMHETSSSETSSQNTKEISKQTNSQREYLPTNTEYLQSLKDDKESIRSLQNFVSQADPETLASVGGGKPEGISPDMVKAASNIITNMPPEEFQKMLEMAASFQGNNPLNSSNRGPGVPRVTPDMLKTATDMMNKMPPEDLQTMFKMSSSTDGGLQSNGSRLNVSSEVQERCENTTLNDDLGNSSSSVDTQEQIKSQMNNPAMREMMSSMMKNMSPDMMTNISEQFGLKLSREDAERAQQAMSSLSPESLNKMMKWANRIQRITEGARNTKNWLLGRNGLVMAITMLLLAVFVHWLGYFGN